MSKYQLRPYGVLWCPARLTNTFRGSGIGLSLVKHAIDAHGGAIEVLSTLGEGSTFIVTLPVMEAEDDA